MKNKKTMLAAILVVAAFAAFSAAAVFEDSQSDASTINGGYTLVTGELGITVDTPDQNYALHTPITAPFWEGTKWTIGNGGADITGAGVEGSDGSAVVSINANSGFSGKLYFGAGDKDRFNAVTVISLANAGGMVFDAGYTYVYKQTVDDVDLDEDAGWEAQVSITPLVNVKVAGNAQGTVKVTEGTLQLGDTDAFNGTVSGNTVTVVSQNTAGLFITAESGKNDVLSGAIIDVISDPVVPNEKYTVDISGKADIASDAAATFTIDEYVTVTVTGTVNILKYSVAGEVEAISNSGIIIVDGTINVAEGADYSTIFNDNGEITVNGKIVFEKQADEADEDALIGGTLNAAYYSTGTTTFTHTYTTLTNAMKASDTIFVSGMHFITEDTVLTGNSALEESADRNAITLIEGATIYTGIGSDFDDATLTAVTVTVPVTTTLTFGADAAIDVQAGKLVWMGTEPAADAGDVIIADVFIIDGNDGIYTDLATALDISASGDTVKIRDTVDEVAVKADATVKNGVTLDANDTEITVSGVTLTVNGKVENAADMTIEGTLVLNSADFAFAAAASGFKISEDGILTFGQAYDNTAEDTGFATLVVDVDNEGSVINVYGKVNLDASAITGTVNVYGKLVFTVEAHVATLFVADTGDVGAAEGKTVYVKDFTAGTAPDNLAQYVNNAKAVVTIDTDGVYTVYGKAAGVKITGGDVSTAYHFGSVLYATVGEKGAATVEIYALAHPELTGKVFQAWFSLPSMVDSSVVDWNALIGAPSSVYGGFANATISVTLQNVPNATWVINEKEYASGNQIVEWAATYTIELKVANGYKLDGGDILVNGVVAGDELANGDSVTFSGNVVPEEVAPDTGLDMQTVLLAVIAAAAVVMAIVFIIRMMRS